jgi:CMP-N-acetylneuraminic acid synthetase
VCSNEEMSLTAIIPVRSGSVRCPSKNSRPFYNSNLLKIKIRTLKNVKGISNIIVSSSDEKLLQIAKEEKVTVHVRDPKFSTNSTTGSELFKCLADAVDDEHMMYVSCMAPFVKKETYEKAIELYFREKNTYDSVVSCIKVNDFLWLDNQPLNYDPHMAPPSQDLPNINALTFGFNILETNYVRESGSVVGKTPFMYQLTELEAIDIDTQLDFTIANLLYSNGFIEDADVVSHISLTCNIQFQVLDCTIRDGGYTNDWNFSYKEVLDMYKTTTLAGVDYFEIGFICNSFNKNNGIWWNVSEKEIQKIRLDYPSGCKLAAMIHLEDIDTLSALSIPLNIDMLRILVNPTKVDVANFKNTLIKLILQGYNIAINMAYADILTCDQIDAVINLVVPGIEYVYIADTFGSIDTIKLKNLIRYIRKKVNVKIGFHGHNNTQQAITNSIEAIKNGASIVDVTIQGIGRGGGNSASELFLQHANYNFNTKYDIVPILEYLDTECCLTVKEKLCILHTHTGLEKLHPNLANELLLKCNMVSIAFEKLSCV